MVFSIMRIRHFKNNVKEKTDEPVLFLTCVKIQLVRRYIKKCIRSCIVSMEAKNGVQNRIYK